MLHPDSVKQQIIERIKVTRLHLAQVKAFVLKNFQEETSKLLWAMEKKFEAQMPEKVIIHSDVPLEPQISAVANALSWRIAFSEAIWQLIGEGVLLRKDERLTSFSLHVPWTTVYQRSSGMSSGWQFDEFSTVLPARLRKSVAWEADEYRFLSDADLFLAEIGVPDLHAEVEISLKEAVRCLRHELFLPCLAMLTRAIEGIWTELGLALITFGMGKAGLSDQRAMRLREVFVSPDYSLSKRMWEVLQLYKQQNTFSSLKRLSMVTPSMLQNAYVWSDTVREARNAIHYGKAKPTPISYETVATLMLGTGQHFRAMYALWRAAVSRPQQDG